MFEPKNPKRFEDEHQFRSSLLRNLPCKYYLIVSVVYNPQKHLSSDFLDELVFEIDKITTMGCKFVLMGDFNINYLNMNKKSSLETILTPYSLQPCNQSVPTMQKFTSLIDYTITDDTSDKHRTKIFKTDLKTDHLATTIFGF